MRGAYIIELEPAQDERGFFARCWCADEFHAHGLNTQWPQASVSYNKTKGTLRGLHYQAQPYEEVKLVRCTKGAIYDVIVDMRPDSGTYRQWIAVGLTSRNRKALYIPRGFAHGFQTLESGSEVLYQISEPYHPEYAMGVPWDDPALGIHWPLEPVHLSSKDSTRAVLARVRAT